MDHSLGPHGTDEVYLGEYPPPALLEVYTSCTAALTNFLSEVNFPEEFYSPSIRGYNPNPVASCSGRMAEWRCELPLSPGVVDIVAIVPLVSDLAFVLAPGSGAAVRFWMTYRAKGMPEMVLSTMMCLAPPRHQILLKAGQVLLMSGNTFHKGPFPHNDEPQLYLKFFIGTPRQLGRPFKPRDLSQFFEIKFLTLTC
ncbi:hypothetical protein VOLCADRAFT_96831 [Volvox carteri f. nagariensis]|uniref:Uncharacterized protein n=1 Tax=Volvox carteri f. nagariensis TaxID=3068 RepID=D8UB63_VOLCA|nr:uncharacterized protein VOLCADRAFT_96831 [Volvox carteri f. nagariensis]EFJ43054.1 hypothetical protein VOLCADRAFT_96831 [Volvox carteri f. nagariensis]|eukprot:XP_002955853.1 hypothetical protein VOLCADRAFT_96831 [Volvox carteri f. nagariensis]